jgi:hypothetical protein
MSDVIWAAAITGTVGIAGNLTTYLVSRRAAATAMQAAEKQADVELAKVNAENERLRDQIRETERANRRDAYQRMAALLDRLDLLGAGLDREAHETDYETAFEEFTLATGGIHLFGTDEVRGALIAVTEQMTYINDLTSERRQKDTSMSYAEAYRQAYRQRRGRVQEATADLMTAMRDDVTREILTAPKAASAVERD